MDAIAAAGIDASANEKAVFESMSPLRRYPITPLLNPNDSTKIAIPAFHRHKGSLRLFLKSAISVQDLIVRR